MNGMVNYAGVLKDGESQPHRTFAAHISIRKKTLRNRSSIPILQATLCGLKDIATIERRNEDPDNYIRQNGKKTILLSLEMQPGNNIVEFGKDVDKALAEFPELLSIRYHGGENIRTSEICERLDKQFPA